MVKARAWATLCVIGGTVGLLTTSCGSDELKKGGGYGGGGIVGGAGGNSGDGGAKGGSGPKGGAGGAKGGSSGTGGSGNTKTSNMGKACVNATTCGANLDCYTGPDVPNGFCTADCVDDSDCEKLSPGSMCVTDPSGGFCIQGCEVGSGSLEAKCQGRDDFSCQLFAVDQSDTLCSRDADCAPLGPAYFCSSNTCIATACLPTCGSDAECGENFCDVGNGFCVPEKPPGLAIGSSCDPNAATDPCAGFCLGNTDGSFALCSGYCTLGVATTCGWDGTGSADSACMFIPGFNEMAASGDAGYCGQLCDCSADCRNPGFSCIELSAATAKVFKRSGFCAAADPGDKVLTTCPSGNGGTGGASGTGGATSTGGSAGAGGGS